MIHLSINTEDSATFFCNIVVMLVLAGRMVADTTVNFARVGKVAIDS